MMQKRLLICGATGFIGRNLTEYFANCPDYQVTATYNERPKFENKNIQWVKCDLTNNLEVRKNFRGKDIVIQAAATTSGAKDIVEKPYVHVADNVVMNSLMLRAAYDYSVSHLLFFSCSVMYNSSDFKIMETDFDASKPLNPSYFGVGWTKVYIEKMCEFYSRIGETKFSVLRHSNIYGPYDKFDLEKSHVFGATVSKVFSSQNKDIEVWGTGRAERDLLYVSDLVDAVERVISRQKNSFELVNIGSGQSISISNLVGKIIATSGKALDIVYNTDKPDIDTKVCLDTGKAERLFDWRPQVPMNEGIVKTLNWFSNFYKVQ